MKMVNLIFQSAILMVKIRTFHYKESFFVVLFCFVCFLFFVFVLFLLLFLFIVLFCLFVCLFVCFCGIISKRYS